jgi:hypothetical protein
MTSRPASGHGRPLTAHNGANVPEAKRPKVLLPAALLALVLSGCAAAGGGAGDEPTPASLPASPTPAARFTLDYPRLAAYNPWGQPLEDIARFDAVLGPYAYPGAIEKLRELNPDILVFDYVNACEVGYNPSPDAGPWDSYEAQSLPAEWFLTQVGSTLAEAVDETETAFHVAEVTATDGVDIYELFVVSDTLLLEGESVLVEEVDQEGRLLTVRRGYVRPAAPHAAETRIAAHVAGWPNSWALNASDTCPLAIVDDAVGPERFADYNARRGIEIVETGPWDGLFLDVAGPNVGDLHWLVSVRTIDLDSSNRLVTDYTAVNESWSAGMRDYEQALREGIGQDKTLYANRGVVNYDIVNGCHYEAFPQELGPIHTGLWWEDQVFGPTDVGSYFDWMARGAEPRFTVIQTFEDDGAPTPLESVEEYRDGARCSDAGFEPNYRKMRFGLATALLNDGFFNFEYSTYAGGWLCPFWFDEFDNAGAGQGYLGQPLGPAFKPLSDLTSRTLLVESAFDDGVGAWECWALREEGYEMMMHRDTATTAQGDGALRLDINASQGAAWFASASISPVGIVAGDYYVLSFWARADRQRALDAVVQQSVDPWAEELWLGVAHLAPGWRYFRLAARAQKSDEAATLVFRAGETTGSVWLDEVALKVGSDHVWRRDYEGGIALVNATDLSHTVPLGGTFQRIRGTQAPEVNDGTLVAEVELPPHDGLILLRVGSE